MVKKSGANRFLYGLLLAAIYLLPIPYWVYISISFSAFGWFFFDPSLVIWALIGSGSGTMSMLLLYIYFFRRRLPIGSFGFNVNFLLGGITAVISLITIIRIIQNM